MQPQNENAKLNDNSNSENSGLEKTLYEAARTVKSLKQTGCRDYADAVLGINGFGGDTAEIYFYRFAPKGSLKPRDPEYRALYSDPEKSKTYENACYQKWARGIKTVQRVVKQYGGSVKIDGATLDTYLREVKKSGETPTLRVHVRITVPGQKTLHEIRETLTREIIQDFA